MPVDLGVQWFCDFGQESKNGTQQIRRLRDLITAIGL